MFFRVKLVAVLLLTLLTLVLTVHFVFLSPHKRDLSDQVVRGVSAANRAVSGMHRVDELAIRYQVENLTNDRRVRQALNCEIPSDEEQCDEERHRSSLLALESWYRSLHASIAENRTLPLGARDLYTPFSDRPTLLILADLEGRVLGRHIGDVSDWWHRSGAMNLMSYDSATFALFNDVVREQRTVHDIISWRETPGSQERPVLTLAAAAPIRQWTSGGRLGPVTGVALIGFPINNLFAADKQSAVAGVSLAYTLQDRIVEGGSDARQLSRCEDEHFINREQTLTATGLGEFLNQANPSLVYEVDCRGKTYLVMRGHFHDDRAGTEEIGYLVVANLSQSLARFATIEVFLPLIAVSLGILGLIVIILLVNRFLNPLLKIDHGIQQVLAGNKDYVWSINSQNPFSAEMAHSLNVMTCYLQDKPLPDDEGQEEDGDWSALLQFADVEITGTFPVVNVTGIPREQRSQKAEEAAQEPQDRFYQRLFDEYLSARNNLGLDSRQITFDRFVAQIRKKTESYKEAHHCSDVRFEVVTKEDKVVLKPIPIKQ